MPHIKEITHHFENLTGRIAGEVTLDFEVFKDGDPLGYSQFNEILSILEQERVSQSFFQYLVDGSTEYQNGSSIKNEKHLSESIDKFRKLALLYYGNVMFAFNQLSFDDVELEDVINDTFPEDPSNFKLRNKPIIEIEKIPKDKTFLLGYLSKRIIDKGLSNNPDDQKLLKLKEERKHYLEIGRKNQSIYLTFDHLDVYVATSMRSQHEFINVDENVEAIFDHDCLKELNLRYFNPTQAFCDGRIEKGLSEALMLKRAKCTIYFVQENDTLGKDSELASTLAQGKPVIAFVPTGNKEYVDNLIHTLKSLDKEKETAQILLEQLMIFDPGLAWEKENRHLVESIDDPKSANVDKLKALLYDKVEVHYDKRANLLMSDHPLGIQVNLKSGVANGVLVVREIDDCAELLRRIVLNEMKFELEVKEDGHLYLKEEISTSIFRLQTADRLLTNTFWNFYLEDDL